MSARRAGRQLATGTAGVILVGLAACTGRAGSTLLNVQVVDAPGGATPSVQVSGPGYRGSVTRSTTLKVTPGSYTVTAAPIHQPAEDLYPVQQSATVTVQKGRTTTVPVDFADHIPHTTKVVAPADVSAVSSRSLVIAKDSPQARQLVPGNVIVASPSQAAPLGLLRKVVRVDHAADGTAHVTTRPASIKDAVPQGRFDVHIALPGPPEPIHNFAASGAPPPSPPFQTDLKVWRRRDANGTSFSCGATATTDQPDQLLPLRLSSHLSLQPSIDEFSGDWGIDGLHHMNFVASLSAQASTTVTATGGFFCQASAELPLRPPGSPLPPGIVLYTFPIGPVDVMVLISLTEQEKGKFTGSASSTLTTSAKLTLGERYSYGTSTPVSALTTNSDLTALPNDVGVDGQFRVGLKLTMLADLVVGPFATLAIGPTMGWSSSTGWFVKGGLYGGVGIGVNLLGFQQLVVGQYPELIKWEKVLQQNTQGPSQPQQQSTIYAPACPPAQPSHDYQPSKIVVACADGNQWLDNLHWTSWTTQAAAATATMNANDCTPNCAQGHFHTYPANVTLQLPERAPDGTFYFSNATVAYPDGGPNGEPSASYDF